MSEKNVILFHIGTPKTGTTALQKFLELNNEQLKQKDWVYPTDGSIGSTISIMNQRFYAGNGTCLLAEDESLFNASLDEILKYANHYNVIVSCEATWLIPTEKMQKIFRAVLKRHNNVKVVVYLRRQDEFIESWHNQTVKWHEGTSLTLSDYVQSLNPKDTFSSYLCKLEVLEKLLGERLIVRRYTKDTIADFLSLMEVELEDAVMPHPDATNVTLGSRLLEIRRIVNGMLPSTRWCDEQFISLNIANVNAGRKDYYKAMSPEMRRDILKTYEAENEEIVRRYFKDGRPLFEDMNVDIPYKEYRATPFEEEMIRVSFQVLNSLQSWVSGLDSLGHYLEAKVDYLNFQSKKIAINLFKGDRKLAYFGAGNICKDCLEGGLYRPDVIVDDKGGREMDGIPVVSFDEINNWKDYYVIITTTVYQKANAKRLTDNGLEEIKDYLTYWDINLNGK